MSKFIHHASALAVIAVGLLCSTGRAASLNLTSYPPDVKSSFVSATYNVTTHTLTATGYAVQLTTPPGNISSISNGAFSLTAVLSVTGTGPTEMITPVSGSLSVTGANGTHNYFGSGDFKSFGFSTINAGIAGISTQTFEFKFGAGTGDYGTHLMGVILSTQVNNPYTTSFFNGGFNNTDNNLYFSATADTFAYPVPLPSAALSGFASLACVPLILRRRRTA